MTGMLGNILPRPVYEFSSNKNIHGYIMQVVERSEPFASGILRDGAAVNRWELNIGKPRIFREYFGALENAYVDELIIKDPYCAAGVRQVEQLGKFVKIIEAMSDSIRKIRVDCKEQSYQNHNYDYPAKIKENVSKALGFADAQVTTNVKDFKYSKGFHDRSVIAKVIGADGEAVDHIYDLTGGIDYLMDQRKETKVFYFRSV